MERSAFRRALRFLDYNPVAKWTAIGAGVGSGLLFVGLIVVLTLYADLMVNKGEIPSYGNLPQREKNALLNYLTAESDEQRTSRQEKYRLIQEKEWDEPAAPNLGSVLNSADIQTPKHEPQLALLWYLTLPELIAGATSADAGEFVRQRLEEHVKKHGREVAVQKNLDDVGALSLIVRSRSTPQNWVAAPIVRWNGWMWEHGNAVYLLGLFLTGLVMALVRVGLIFLGDYKAAQTVIEAITRLRRALYHHTYRLGTLAVRALGPSEAVSVSTRHLQVLNDGMFAWLTVVFREPVKFVLLLAFALLVNFWLALAFLLFAFLVWVGGGQIAAYFRRQGRLAAEQSANQLTLLQESLMLMRLVKVYLMESFNQTRVERQLARLGDAQLQRYRGEAIYRPVFALMGLVAVLTLLWVAGFVVLRGHLGVSSAMAMLTALVCMYWPLTQFLEHRRHIRRARRSAQVLFEFLDRPGSVGQVVGAELLPHLSQRLEFESVTLKESGTQRKLLRGVNLAVEAGQRVALIGPEDHEKYAIVYLLARFLDPAGGEIRIDGKNLRWVTLDSLRNQIAIVLQHNLVFNDTVANNIGCGDPAYPLPRIIEAAKVAHAHQFIQKLPQGYETPIGELGHVLNIGEQYRIALARALLRDSALLIIEEPHTPLDEDTKGLVDDTLTRALPGKTVIFLAHRLSTIRGCDRVFLLYEGRIEAAGEHRELLASSELYRHLQYLEFNEFAGMISATQADVTAAQAQ